MAVAQIVDISIESRRSDMIPDNLQLPTQISGGCVSTMKASLFSPFLQADVQGLKGASQYNGWDAHFCAVSGWIIPSSVGLSLLSFFFVRGCEGIVIEGPNDKGRWEVQVPLGSLLGFCFFWVHLVLLVSLMGFDGYCGC